MPNSSEVLGNRRATRCTVCDGKFGLVHYYSWQTPLCSKKCVERFRARRESDRNWVVGTNSPSTRPENHVRAL
jgi:hypothetical protein